MAVEMSNTALWTLTSLWLLLMLTILGLNLPVAYVFWFTDQLRSPKNMYIASMLITDILLAVVIPGRVYLLHVVIPPGAWRCRLVGYLSLLMVNVNMYSVLALTLARHTQITRAHRCPPLTRHQAFRIIAIVWTVTILASFRVTYLAVDVGPPPARLLHNDSSNQTYVAYVSVYHCMCHSLLRPRVVGLELLVDYLLPLTVIVGLALNARRFLRDNRYWDPADSHKHRDELLVCMVFVLALCFYLTHGPEVLRAIVSDLLGQAGRNDVETEFIVYEVCQMCMFSSGISNVLVYVIFNRRAAAALVRFLYKRRKLRKQSETNSNTPTNRRRGRFSRVRMGLGMSLTRPPSLMFPHFRLSSASVIPSHRTSRQSDSLTYAARWHGPPGGESSEVTSRSRSGQVTLDSEGGLTLVTASTTFASSQSDLFSTVTSRAFAIRELHERRDARTVTSQSTTSGGEGVVSSQTETF